MIYCLYMRLIVLEPPYARRPMFYAFAIESLSEFPILSFVVVSFKISTIFIFPLVSVESLIICIKSIGFSIKIFYWHKASLSYSFWFPCKELRPAKIFLHQWL